MVNLTNNDEECASNELENVLFKKEKIQRLKFQLKSSKDGYAIYQTFSIN